MPAVLKRVNSYGHLQPSVTVITDGEAVRKQWNSFTPGERDIAYFKEIAHDHQLLIIEYSAHCALARELLLQGDDSEQNKAKIIRQLEAALILAELLEYLHQHYLIVPREVARLRGEQATYRGYLAKYGYQFTSPIEPLSIVQSYSKTIREQTLPANLMRHMVARSKRLLTMIAPLIEDPTHYKRVTGHLDWILVPTLSYAAWLFFVPRAAVNLYLMGKHVIPGSWMSEQEKALGWKTRFKSQLERRWFELGNDIAALVANLLNCFLFVGPLLPFSIYVTTASLSYDVGLACLRAYIEISRLKKLENQYKEMLAGSTLSDAERDEINGYIRHLEQRIAYEQKRLAVQVAIAAALLIAFVLTFPIFASPIIPIVGAALAVLTTALWYRSIKSLINQKPIDKVPALPPPPVDEEAPDATADTVELLPPAKPQNGLSILGLFGFRSSSGTQRPNGSDSELARFVVS